jgi:hypothetical protein
MPGATVILMTRRKGNEEIAFQLQLLAGEGKPLPCGEVVDKA